MHFRLATRQHSQLLRFLTIVSHIILTLTRVKILLPHAFPIFLIWQTSWREVSRITQCAKGSRSFSTDHYFRCFGYCLWKNKESGRIILWYFSLPSTSIGSVYLWYSLSVMYGVRLALRGSRQLRLIGQVIADP